MCGVKLGVGQLGQLEQSSLWNALKRPQLEMMQLSDTGRFAQVLLQGGVKVEYEPNPFASEGGR